MDEQSPIDDLLEAAWGIIANAGWDQQSQEWVEAAERWRDKYHEHLDSGYVELTGDDIPYHLRSNASPLARCTRCVRLTWSADEVGKVCGMTQSDASMCDGAMEAIDVG